MSEEGDKFDRRRTAALARATGLARWWLCGWDRLCQRAAEEHLGQLTLVFPRMRWAVERVEVENSLSPCSKILAEVRSERRHQLARGWTTEHDAQCYRDGSIAQVAATLANPTTGCCPHRDLKGIWDLVRQRNQWSRRRQIIVAMAMLAAEVERLDAQTVIAG